MGREVPLARRGDVERATELALVAEAASVRLGPGDHVGCSEGADAIWLARRSWTVTAIDISISPYAGHGRLSSWPAAAVEWLSADALQTPGDLLKSHGSGSGTLLLE